ncbi:hypothetical protein [Streptomyces sp. SP18CS02]|nr:hypothetical protein [Streptomyces sp. SP18CS02]MEE1751744.1 hypothetical protein [Streptomyces sp. SP18CS02]
MSDALPEEPLPDEVIAPPGGELILPPAPAPYHPPAFPAAAPATAAGPAA